MTNEHVFSYLDYYIALPHPPHYAVLINGAWGMGKSFAIKGYIDKLKRLHKTVVYVSLYGAKTVDDVDVMLLTGAHSLLDNTAVKYGARFAKAAFKKMSFGDEAKLADFLPKSKIDLIVFDDLERAQMSPAEVLGYINAFVEHDGMSVVIVCNEAEVSDQPAYRRIREKVVGTTFDLRPQEREALDVFIAQVSDESARTFLTNHTDDTIAIFQQSETGNLRLLKQTIWAWSRFFEYIDGPLRERTKGMLAAYRLFIALSIEIKAGRISRDDLNDRVAKIVAGRKKDSADAKGTPLSIAQHRYKMVRLHDTVINDSVLSQVLCEGWYDAEAITQSLSRSEYFLMSEAEPAWQKVWYGSTRDTAEFDTAVEKIERQFADRELIEGHEILHVFGLRLWCASIGQIPLSQTNIVDEGKAYVNDLFESGMLLKGFHKNDHDGGFSGAYGLSFHQSDTQAFAEFYRYYLDRCLEAMKDTWPALLEILMQQMETGTESFFAEVCRTNDDRPNTFAYIPIFSVSNAGEFVRRLLACSPEDQRIIFTALKGRYESFRLQHELKDERNWLVEVRNELRAKVPAMRPIRRSTTENYIKRIIDPFLT